MIIKRNQLEQLGNGMVEAFISKSVLFLKENFPDWSSGKTDAEISLFVEKMIQLGDRFRVYKEINIQKLLHYQVAYKFALPLPKALELRLTAYTLEEDSRMENFYLSLLSNSWRLIPVTLSSII